VADEDDGITGCGVSASLRVHLRHERAGRVDRPQAARGRCHADGGGDAVSREDDEPVLGNVLDALDEDGAL
jgi:hypothetical protein